MDGEGSGGICWEGWAVPRRGSGQGDCVCRRVDGWWEQVAQLEQKDVGGRVRGRDGDTGALTKVCCVPENRQGQMPVKVSVFISQLHKACCGVEAFLGVSPPSADSGIWGLCDAATFQRRGEAGGHMRPSPGQPGTGFHVHSPVVG